MSLGDGLVCTDEDHRITVWNPGASAIFGYMPAEIIGRPFETRGNTASGSASALPSIRKAGKRLTIS
jgi:PAS domain S-box-containing protein